MLKMLFTLVRRGRMPISARKPPLCKGRCQPNRLTEGLLCRDRPPGRSAAFVGATIGRPLPLVCKVVGGVMTPPYADFLPIDRTVGDAGPYNIILRKKADTRRCLLS